MSGLGRSKFFGLLLLLAAGCSDAAPPEEPAVLGALSQNAQRTPMLRWLGRYTGDSGFDNRGAEIVAYHAANARLFISNAGAQRIDIVALADPATPTLVNTLDTTPFGAVPTSVAVDRNGVVAVSVVANDPQSPGTLVVFDMDGQLLGSVEVGASPDMVTFSPDGRLLLVANEGEPSQDYLNDPEGSVSVVRVHHHPPVVRQSTVRTLGFDGFDPAELDPSIRISGPNATLAQDLEPEFIAVAADSRTAWVTLQENNALAVIDLRRNRVRQLVGLGFQDHALPGFGLDASDRDDAINIANYPILGIRQPDGVASFRQRGRQYVITANEGDIRDYDAFVEDERCANLVLDPTHYPDAAALQEAAALGRLSCSTVDGDVDADGDIDQIYSFGSRSFSIFDAEGELVFDSGDEFEQTTAALQPANFNCTNDENDSFDNRSDNKGPEPEGVVVGRIRGHIYAFIGLERIGGIMMYDVSNPHAPVFIQYINSRDFSGDPELGTAGDLATEGLAFIPASQSPNGKALLVAAYEVSGTTAIFEVD